VDGGKRRNLTPLSFYFYDLLPSTVHRLFCAL
jgi:hypothetical protein